MPDKRESLRESGNRHGAAGGRSKDIASEKLNNSVKKSLNCPAVKDDDTGV